MKKRMVALMTAVFMATAPISVMAEETDYSYLEEMSVKELRDLRDAINEILGDDGGTSGDDITAKHPEWKTLDAESDPYATAILLTQALKESLYDRDSFQLNSVSYYKPNSNSSTQWYFIEYSGANQLGGVTSSCTLFKMVDGELADYLDKSNRYLMQDKNYDTYRDMQDGDIGETLDYKFIEYKMD